VRLTATDWKRRAEAREKQRQNSSYERRQQILATARQIRRELRDERKKAL
jgi:hypothetical protein